MKEALGSFRPEHCGTLCEEFTMKWNVMDNSVNRIYTTGVTMQTMNVKL